MDYEFYNDEKAITNMKLLFNNAIHKYIQYFNYDENNLNNLITPTGKKNETNFL